MLESLFNKVADLKVFSYEICEVFKNTFFEEHLQETASVVADASRSAHPPVASLSVYFF